MIQRQSTNVTVLISWLSVMKIINEPTSVITYRLEKKSNQKKNILIFDLWRTFDVSLLSMEGVFEVKSTSCDTHLWDEDYNSRLFNHFIQEFKENTRKISHQIQEHWKY